MNQDERLDYLIEAFKNESLEYKNIISGQCNRKMLLRSMMNIRMPNPIASDVLKVQDEFLQQETLDKGIVRLEDILTIKEEYESKVKFADKISVWQGDITRLATDAIVNAANSKMLGCFIPCHRCIDNAIHSAAGIELRQACNQYMTNKRKVLTDYDEPTGSAAITPGYNLPCKCVIHTVGPIVAYGLTKELCLDLKHCYESCLQAALDNGIRSLAFCCISTGEFHFPNEEAAGIAIDTVMSFLNEHGEKFDRIIFNVFKDSDKEIYKSLLSTR